MTVSSQTNNATFVGNGVTTVFPLPFRFFANGDVFAYFIDSTTGASTPMSLGVDYTLTGAGEPEVNGNAVSVLTTTAPLANGRGLYVERVMPQVQETDIVNQGQFFASTHEDVFDRLTMLIQQANANSAGAIRVAIGDPEPTRLVPAAVRASLLLGFDGQGNPIAVAPASGSASDLAMRLANNADPAKGAALVGYKGRTVAARLGDMVSVKDFGAVPDGSAVGGTDNTAAFNAALATGRKVFVPSGDYRIKGTIIVPPGASLVGDGRTISNIFVTPDYDMAVSAFIRLGHSSEIRDIGIKFVQPDSSNRATLTAYPWAIDFNDSARVVIDFVRVSSAWNAITGTGNTGGSYIGFIEVGALNTGLTIDGALDFFHGLKWHFWPFFTEPDLANATNLLQAFGDGQATAFSLGAVDGFNVENIATFQQKVVIKTNANPVIPNLFGHMQLDGDGSRLIVSGGVNAVGKLYETKSNTTTVESVSVNTAGVLDVGYFRVSSNAQQYSAKVHNSAKLHIHSGDIQSVNPLGGAVFVQGGIAILEDCTMSPAPDTAYSNAYCVNANGIMKVRRCRWTTRGAGSGSGIFFVPDNVENEAVQNFLGGWGLGWNFSGRPIGIYANNTGAGSDFRSSDLTGCIKSASYQATSDAAGKLTLPHGVLNLQLKLLRADAYSKGNSGEAIACAVVVADATNLYIEGAQPSRALRVSIQYTDNPLSTW